MVKISGTNFRLPDLVPGSETPQESVRVRIGTVVLPPETVMVRSTTRVDIVVPPDISDPAIVPYPLDLAITVWNIDALGVPIPLETATLILGFSYVKASLSTTVLTQQVFRTLRRYLARVFEMPVVGLVHVDYQSDALLTLPEGIQAPCIVLVGPRLQSSPEGTEELQNKIQGLSFVPFLPKAYDHIYEVLVLHTNKLEMDSLHAQLEQVIRVAPAIPMVWQTIVQNCTIRWETVPSLSGASAFSGSVQQLTGEIMIERVPAEVFTIREQFELTDIDLSVI
jgi:hypothetical protein